MQGMAVSIGKYLTNQIQAFKHCLIITDRLPFHHIDCKNAILP